MVVDRHGDLISRAPQFVQTLMITDLELPEAQAGATYIDQTAIVTLSSVAVPDYEPSAATVANPLSTEEEIYRALVLALGDYVRKNGFTSVILGLSGGIDSALVAAIAVDALGPENVHGVSMPSVHSSQHSRDDAADLAERTSLHFRTVEIAPMVDAFEAQLNLTGLAAENLQARVRGVTLMGISNEEGQLVLATGNKSELAVGYSTIYGDAVGGYAPIKDVAKTQVWNLSRWRNEAAIAKGQTPPIPPNSIEKEPSAELRPGQLDSDSLPDYDVLDDVLDDYVENDRSAAELIADGFDSELVLRVLRLTDLAEYKRRQYPPGTKISSRAFGRDRRLPITNKWRERPL
jgi:NAD+ synthase (glutamine-hydrolysing)